MDDPESMLFVSKDCPNCEIVKKMLGENHGVAIYDVSTVDGLVEAAFYGLVGKSVPLLLVFVNGDSKIYTDIKDIMLMSGCRSVYEQTACKDGVCQI
jgi:hypothetical protein